MVHYSVYLIGRFSTRTMVGFMVDLTRHLNDLRFICFDIQLLCAMGVCF